MPRPKHCRICLKSGDELLDFTWPGVFFAEDRMALDILCAREDVDESRIGCGGLSGGGMRTVFTGGLDKRIKCAVCGIHDHLERFPHQQIIHPYVDDLCSVAA